MYIDGQCVCRTPGAPDVRDRAQQSRATRTVARSEASRKPRLTNIRMFKTPVLAPAKPRIVPVDLPDSAAACCATRASSSTPTRA